MPASYPNIAVLGMNHGWRFINALLNRPDYIGGRLAAVSDLLEPAKELPPSVKFYKDYGRMFDELESGLDGIIAALPNHLHLPITEEVGKRGLALLLEKPVAATFEQANKIVDVVRETKIPFMVGHHRRFSTQVNLAKEIIDSGKIGKIVGVNVIWTCRKPDGYYTGPFKWRVTKGVGGPLVINAIHDIDNLRYLLGEIDTVHAFINNGIRGNDVEDAGVVNLRFKSGAMASYFLSDGVPSKLYYEACTQEDVLFHPVNEDCYQFFGQKGTLAFPTMRITSYDDGRSGGADWTRPFKGEAFPVGRLSPYEEELKHFCDMIGGRATTRCSAEDAAKTLQVIEAIRESGETGRAVSIR